MNQTNTLFQPSPVHASASRARRRQKALLKIALLLLAGMTTSGLLAVAAPLVVEAIFARSPSFVPEENPASALGLPYEDVTFPTEGGLHLRGWFIPASNPTAPAVLYAHGAGDDQRSGFYLVPFLHEAGYHVLLFSYRDFGASDRQGRGLTYGDSESQDIEAAVRFLREERGIRRVGVIGYSVGASSAILAAARTSAIDAVVAVAPFACLQELWAESRPPPMPAFVPAFTFKLVSWRKGFTAAETCPLLVVNRIAPRPLLLVHGTHDERVPFANSHRLFEAAGEPKALWLVEGATHESVKESLLNLYGPDLRAFLAHLKTQTP